MIRVTIKDDDGKVIQSMTYPMDMTYPMEVMVQEPRPAPKKKESFSLVGLAGKGIKNLIVNRVKDKYFGGLL